MADVSSFSNGEGISMVMMLVGVIDDGILNLTSNGFTG